MLYMLASVGQPSLRGRDACMVLRVREASWRNCMQILHKTSFSPLFVFLLSRISCFFWSGVVLWHLWIGSARVMHLVVFYGYQGADRDPERLALTDQLLDAALNERGVVAREQPCFLVGDFNVEPPRFLAWQKGSWLGSGLIWRHLGLLLLAEFLWLPVGKIGGPPWGLVVISWWAAVSGCEVVRDRWVVPHSAVRTCFDYSRWLARVSLLLQRTPLWPASWLPFLDKSRGSKAAEVQRVWDIYDDRLQFMSRDESGWFFG